MTKRRWFKDACGVDLTIGSGDFTLEFTRWTKGEEQEKVALVLEDYWIGVLVAELKKVAEKRMERAEALVALFPR